MIYLATFVVVALATAWLAWAVWDAEVFEPLRSWVINKYGQGSWPVKLIRCYWCLSFWASCATCSWTLTCAALLNVIPTPVAAALWPLSIPAVAYAAAWILDKQEN